jgi:hypothetical protein
MLHHIGNFIILACFGLAASVANQEKKLVVVVGADWALPAAVEGFKFFGPFHGRRGVLRVVSFTKE